MKLLIFHDLNTFQMDFTNKVDRYISNSLILKKHNSPYHVLDNKSKITYIHFMIIVLLDLLTSFFLKLSDSFHINI
jgi:hypothetical protein